MVDVDQETARILKELPSTNSLAGMRLEPCEFERCDEPPELRDLLLDSSRALLRRDFGNRYYY